METNKLELTWIIEELDQCKVVNLVQSEVHKLKNQLDKIFSEYLNCNEINLADFFILLVAFHFIEDLLNHQYIVGLYLDSIYPHERTSNHSYLRTTLLFCDLDETKNYISSYLHKKLPAFKKLAKKNKLPMKGMPITFLELIEKEYHYFDVEKFTYRNQSAGIMSLVRPEISETIRCSYHKIDQELIKSGKPRQSFQSYNITQMIEIFSKHDKISLSEDNIIENCLIKYPFGVYLKSDKYFIRVTSVLKHIPTIAEIKNDIKTKVVNQSFKYPIEGLVRLSSDSLKQMLSSGVIRILHPKKREKLPLNHPEKHNLPFILLEQSFGEYILGERKVIEPNATQIEIEISPHDLVFIKHEVHAYIASIENVKTNTTNSTVKVKQTGRHHAEKRAETLKAGVSVIFRYKTEVTGGTKIYELIKKHVTDLWESRTQSPLSSRNSSALLNKWLKPLCKVQIDESSNEQARIFGAALSIISNSKANLSFDNLTQSAKIVAEKIYDLKNDLGLTSTIEIINSLIHDAMKQLT